MIAEFLLKRTTATAVCRVYEDFLVRFPQVQDLELASEEDLTECLSGVGLQRQRARSLKRLSAWLLTNHEGDVPRDLESLLAVPGLGDYSAAAILSFGLGVPIAILDANVERILLRVFGDSLPVRPSRPLLYDVAQKLLPREWHRKYNYGLLDLGRLTCKYSNPKCGECPLTPVCDFFVRSKGKGTHQVEKRSTTAHPSKLRAIRRDRGLSIKRLAEIAEVSKLTVIQIENGRTLPQHNTLEKLGRALQVRPEELSV